MSDSRAYQIVKEIRDRVSVIDRDSGYQTDAGLRVLMGRQQVNEDQLYVGPQLQVHIPNDEPQEPDTFYDPMHIRLNIIIDGFIRVLDGDFNRSAFDLIQDIKSAVLIATDLTLAGLALDCGYTGFNIEYPVAGGDVVGVSLGFSVLYEETYGTP